MDGQLLFRGDSILHLRPVRLSQLQDQVASASDDQLANQDFLQELEADFIFRVPALDERHISTSEDTMEVVATVVDAARLDVPVDSKVSVPVEKFHIPFSGDRDLFFVQPSTYLLTIPRVVVKSDEIIVAYRKDGKSIDEIRARFLSDIAAIRENLFTLEGNCSAYNFGLRHEIESAVEAELVHRQQSERSDEKHASDVDVDEAHSG
ncbi:MAG TPA: hypothetical protein VNI20_10730 [Fimbriimonadaceae bacterium]|nr:hypothetical protein [Fimbriimonadaceae bacterium]